MLGQLEQSWANILIWSTIPLEGCLCIFEGIRRTTRSKINLLIGMINYRSANKWKVAWFLCLMIQDKGILAAYDSFKIHQQPTIWVTYLLLGGPPRYLCSSLLHGLSCSSMHKVEILCHHPLLQICDASPQTGCTKCFNISLLFWCAYLSENQKLLINWVKIQNIS